jgi:Putative restriction endonuclease
MNSRSWIEDSAMRMPSVNHATKPPAKTELFVPPFENGDCMDQKTFHKLYEKTPEGFKAELIGGVVHMASPVSKPHGKTHRRLCMWLDAYVEETPGVEGYDNTTSIQGEKSEPQPDLTLIVEPEFGGLTAEDSKGCIVGPAEFVIEIAHSLVSIDRHCKFRDYERVGVREYLIVIVKSERIEWYGRGKKGFAPFSLEDDGTVRSRVFPGL